MPGQQGSRGGRSRMYVWFERAVLSAGMALVASVIERRLLRALKTGRASPAPRTAADAGAGLPEATDAHTGEVGTRKPR